MSETSESPEANPPDDPQRAQHLSARVPQHVSSGKFSTGAVVLTGPSEFVVDFVQAIGGPPFVAARVVMPHAVLPKFIDALGRNLELYQNNFGPPPTLPRPPGEAKKPSVQQIYDELKISDDVLTGAYANGVMITHTASEFRFDFLTNLFPTSAVAARVFLSTPQVPRLHHSLQQTLQQFHDRLRSQQQDPEPPPDAPTADNDE